MFCYKFLYRKVPSLGQGSMFKLNDEENAATVHVCEWKTTTGKRE